MCLARCFDLSRNLRPHEGFLTSAVDSFALQQAFLARCRRTYAINFLRTIHRLASANKVTICAVFFFKPR